MVRWFSRGVATVCLGFVIGAGVSAALVACVSEDSSLWRVIRSLRNSSDYTLPADADRELARFDAVYREYAADPTNTKEIKQFRDAFSRVRTDYLQPVADAALIDAAVKGVRSLDGKPGTVASQAVVEAGLQAMVASLDPHSAYLNADELKEAFISTRGQFGGLGIEVTMEEGFVKVVSPIEGTPAYRAGMRSGDLITHLDGESIQGISIADAVRRMRGEPGTDIRLTVRRPGVPTFDFTITRAVIKVQAVRWRTEGDVGYLRVASFNEPMADGVREAMQGIRDRLGPRLKGIVLDLRSNPGGLLDQSLALADDFLDSGRIVSVRGRDPRREQVFDARPGDEAAGLPMVVLINGGSASASEIVASALQEDGRATIMGTRSFGKGSVQTITPLPIEGALKLTTALYYAPSGQTIQGQGVIPDIVVAGEDQPKRQREADLPGALSSGGREARRSLATIDEKRCPELPDAREDRMLGCALTFVQAGSADRFLAAIATGARM